MPRETNLEQHVKAVHGAQPTRGAGVRMLIIEGHYTGKQCTLLEYFPMLCMWKVMVDGEPRHKMIPPEMMNGI